MTLEQEIFDKYLIMRDKLLSYGFYEADGGLIYTKPLTEENFKIVLEYDGELHGKIIDLADGGEYTNFRITGASGFSAEVRRKFTALLSDIREKCCKRLYFRYEQAQRINEYIIAAYDCLPEFLWAKFPSYGVYRRKENGKWFAFIGSVPLCKLTRSADKNKGNGKEVEVLNVKADSSAVGRLITQKGFYPAYHMNKKYWVSAVLDGTVSDAKLRELIDESYASVSGGSA